MSYKELLERINISDNDVLNVYLRQIIEEKYYFTFVVGYKNMNLFFDDIINVVFYTPIEFETLLKKYDKKITECYLLNPDYILKEKLKFKH